MSRSNRFNRSAELIKARKSSDPETGALAEMQLAHEILDPRCFEEEADLATTAYLNYRYLTPYQRTELMAATYEKWFRTKQLNDYGRQGRRVDKGSLAMWSDREIAGLWRARQHADALGMAYEPYIIATMSHAVDRGYGRLPAPNQLYTPVLVAGAVAFRDSHRASVRYDLLPIDCDARFLAENFVGDPVQVAAGDAIEADVRKAGKSGAARKLAGYMRERRIISEAEARRRLGDELVDEALAERLWNPVRPEDKIVQGQGNVPGCIGHYRAANHPICGACPAALACVDRAGKVEEALQAKHGTADVRALKIKEGNRERKRRQRDRKREGKTMTLQEQSRILREAGDPKVIKKRLDAKKRRDDNKARLKGVDSKGDSSHGNSNGTLKDGEER